MMHSKKRIIKRVVIACLILVVSGVWLVGYIDVNKRFPKPEQFICAGLMATMSLVVSLYVNNAFIVLLFPSVLCEFVNAVSTWIPVKYRYIKGAAPWRLFRIDQVAINYWQSYVIFICVVLLFDLVIYVWRGVKNDAL